MSRMAKLGDIQMKQADEKLDLDLNDGSILTHIARRRPQNTYQRSRLMAMLSPDGKLVAQVLLGKKTKSSGSAVKTAEGLRNWANDLQKTPSTSRRTLSAKRKP